MNDLVYEKWNKFHQNTDSRKELSYALRASWKMSDSFQIDAENSLPLTCSEEEFNNKKERTKSLCYYANVVIKANSENFANCNFVIALFDKTGCLIRLYGDKDYLKWAKKNKIEEKSIWDEKIIGTNAVSLGLKSKKSISLIGEENFSRFAINFATYFSPIFIDNESNELSEYGGVAIITPIETQNPSFSFTVSTISRAIAWNFYWFISLGLFFNSLDGCISIDQSNNRNKIIFISNETFNHLQIPVSDIYYRNLEQIIDPYPDNKQFWNIIHNNIRTEDTDIKLSIMKKQVKINFSTTPYYASNHNIKGIILIINSKKRINNLISKHVGNTAPFTFSKVIGQNENYINILKQAESAASSSINVLLLGESGVGKDVIAQSIHNASERKDRPFIAVNCAAFPKDLISSELFGYEDGAFTGAKKGGNIGKFELANQGTLFLDEIGDMPLDLQAILLRVIEEKSFMKIGSNTSTNIDVRIIAATNKNLKEKVKKGEFREDLYYRLGVIRLVIPPLRNRKDDILLLTDKFIDKICTRVNKDLVTLSPEARDFFIQYKWPGNVRELQNLLEGVIQLNNDSIITYEYIYNYLSEDTTIEENEIFNDAIEKTPSKENSLVSKSKKRNKNQYLPNTTKEDIIKALEINKYNRTDTAHYLGISRNTLYIRMKEYNLM